MKKFQLFFAFVLLSFVFISCGDDVDCTEAVLEAAAEPLTDAWFDASVDFGLDASEENCKTFKSASEDYLDFLNDHKECAEEQGSLDDWQEAVDELEGIIDGLDC